jgi:site-specific DNA-cytosine methylase
VRPVGHAALPLAHGDVTEAAAPPIRTTDQAHFKVVREDEHGVTLKRKFTILEVKRLFGFPDDYVLEGRYPEQWAQLGNSVCPAMSRAVGEALARVLKCEGPPGGGPVKAKARAAV